MLDQNTFDTVTRLKLRFPSSDGLLTAEDLWDLPLTSTKGRANLDDVARTLHAELQSQGEAVSFVTAQTKSDAALQLKFDIVKHIIDVQIAEKEKARTKRESAEKKQIIMGILAQKKNDELLGKTPAELEAMLAAWV